MATHTTGAERRSDGEPYGSEEHKVDLRELLEDKTAYARRSFHEAGERIREEASERASSLLSDGKRQVVRGIQDVAKTLRHVSEQLREDDRYSAARYSDRAADRLERFSGYFREKDLRQIAEDVDRVVRKEPMLFTAGALAVGVLIGRMIKGSPSESGSGSGHSATGDKRFKSEGDHNSHGDAATDSDGGEIHKEI